MVTRADVRDFWRYPCRSVLERLLKASLRSHWQFAGCGKIVEKLLDLCKLYQVLLLAPHQDLV
jgi:hypothetical protein